MDKVRESDEPEVKKGFTLIEVMLFLAISGLLLVGVMGGTYRAIATQRYNDSVRSFSEYLRQIYAEVISPESLGAGNSNDYAIYGKLVVFGLDEENKETTVYSATLVGDTEIPTNSGGFIEELGTVNAGLFCGIDDTNFESTVSIYHPLWQTRIQNIDKETFTGSVIIARSPTSGTVHTAFTSEQFDIKSACSPTDHSASTRLTDALKRTPNVFSTADDVNFCLRSEDSSIVRDIRVGADGRNTSAINIIDADSEDNQCQ